MTTTTSPPPKSSSRPFIIAMLLMLLVIGGLVVYTLGGDEAAVTAAPPVDTAPTAAAAPDHTLPPPPPPIASEDAGPAPEAKKKVVVGSTFCSSCGKCEGTAAANFQSVVRGRAASAQRCYEKALAQQEGLQGKLSVSLCVGVGGGVCGASIANDSLGSPLVSQCVLNIFRATTFPSPKNGCVDAQVPLNFVPQKQ
jgi:outer membrane biosynthesis protein TonB